MPDNEYGDLAAALAKAQASFPPISRDKEVTVTSKSGASYRFKYAPLDSIIAAVRGPLAANGLAIAQLLDDDYLVTMLLHTSGARLTGRTPIPAAEGIQQFGSAITYLRRYSIVALLGIATEEDDDGNRAAGNDAKFTPRTEPEHRFEAPVQGGLVGTAEIGKAPSDFELRVGPGGSAISFRLVDGRQSIKVVCLAPLADALYAMRAEIIGKRVTCWGKVAEESFVKDGKTINFRVLTLERIQTVDFTLPAESVPMFSEAEQAALELS